MDQIKRLQHQSEMAGSVAFFHHGDFVTLHGSDAQWYADTEALADDLFVISDQPYIPITLNLYARVLARALLEQGRPVREFMKQRTWSVSRTGTPGNLGAFVQELASHPLYQLATDPAAAYIEAVSIQHGFTVGMAIYRAVSHSISLIQFTDGPRLPRTASALVQLGVREIMMIDSSPESIHALRQVAEASEVPCNIARAPQFSPLSVVQDALTAPLPPSINMTTHDHALSAAAAAITGLSLLPRSLNLTTAQLGEYELLPSDIRALHLLPSDASSSNQLPTSVLAALDFCMTKAGTRLLAQWIRVPLVSPDAIRQRQDIVGALLLENDARSRTRTILKATKSLDVLANRLRTQQFNLDDLVQIYIGTTQLQEVSSTLLGMPELAELSTRAGELCGRLTNYRSLMEDVLDPALLVDGVAQLRPVGEELERLARLQEDQRRLMEQERLRAAAAIGVQPQKITLEDSPQLGYYMRITKSFQATVARYYQILEVRSSGGVRFISPELRAAAAELARLTEMRQVAQATVHSQVMEVASTYKDEVQDMSSLLAEVDVFCSLAEAAARATIPWCRPTILEGPPRYELCGGRHVLLEPRLGSRFVPQSITLAECSAEAGAAREPGQEGPGQLVVITGANCSGKSTLLRLVGVNAVLAQIGSFVPADSLSMTPFTHVLTRVGAEDSLSRGLSTFLLEMTEVASILDAATPKSLVLIDELGRGTSTADGAALAHAVAAELADRGCLVLFATHYHSLSSLTDEIPDKVRSMHTAATVDQLGNIRLQYKLLPGAVSHSFGVECAAALGFPEDVVAIARRELGFLQQVEDKSEIDFGKVAQLRQLLRLFVSGDESACDKIRQLVQNQSQLVF